MKKEQLYEALGEINEDYINDAHQTAKKKSHPVWMKWGAMAACLCLVVIGVFIAPNFGDGALDYVETVIYNNAEYAVCGEGETNILKECGLPTEITEDLAGKHLGYLEQAEKNTYYISEENRGNIELFEYAPQPNDNVYIICIDGKYYTAIRRDNKGYHGLPIIE